MANSLPKNDRKSINDYLLTEEQISSGTYPKEEVFEARVEEKVLGPFWQEDLKDFVIDAGLVDSDTEIRNIDTDNWMSINEHPLFQRRKPSLVKESDLSSPENRYFLLKSGRKLGPFTSEELKNKIEELEILFTDYVSIDEGQSWGKIYEIEGFNRRDLKPSNLPQMPDKETLGSSLSDASQAINKSKETDDSLVSLAYIGHLNEGKKKFHIEEKKHKDKDVTSKKTETNKSKVFIALTFIMAIFAGIYFFIGEETKDLKSNINTAKKKLNKTKIKTAKETTKKALRAKPVVKKTKPVKKAPRPLKVAKKKKIVTRGAKDIKKAAFFKKKKLQDRQDLREVDVPPEAIFDDNTDPVELDPIRQRISKDIIDPELEAYDEDTPLDELEDISRQIAPLDEFEDEYDREPAAYDEGYEDEYYNE